AIRRELHDRFGPDAETQGLRVRTTLDAGLQRIAEKELLRQIQAVESGKLGVFAGEKCDGAPDDCLEGLFVAIDAHTGDVRALVAAFAPFANGGDRVLPRFIDEVSSATGDVLLKNGVITAQALQPGAAFIMASLLSDVVERGTGVGARAGLPPDLPVLGKTGT